MPRNFLWFEIATDALRRWPIMEGDVVSIQDADSLYRMEAFVRTEPNITSVAVSPVDPADGPPLVHFPEATVWGLRPVPSA